MSKLARCPLDNPFHSVQKVQIAYQVGGVVDKLEHVSSDLQPGRKLVNTHTIMFVDSATYQQTPANIAIEHSKRDGVCDVFILSLGAQESV